MPVTAVAASESPRFIDARPVSYRLRGILRMSRRAFERRLHPIRRARIGRALANLPANPTILVICLGNICRSPYAELRLRDELQKRGRGDVRIASAGLMLPGRPSPPEARRASASRGLDLTDHRSRAAQSEIVNHADAVLVMSRRQQLDLAREFGRTTGVLILGDADPGPIATRTIKDPIEQPQAVYETVYDRIDQCCREVVRMVSPAVRHTAAEHKTDEAERPGAARDQPEGDVDDEGLREGRRSNAAVD